MTVVAVRSLLYQKLQTEYVKKKLVYLHIIKNVELVKQNNFVFSVCSNFSILLDQYGISETITHKNVTIFNETISRE